MIDFEIISKIEYWLNHHKDVNVFYISRRAKIENWSLEKINEVVKYV